MTGYSFIDPNSFWKIEKVNNNLINIKDGDVVRLTHITYIYIKFNLNN